MSDLNENFSVFIHYFSSSHSSFVLTHDKYWEEDSQTHRLQNVKLLLVNWSLHVHMVLLLIENRFNFWRQMLIHFSNVFLVLVVFDVSNATNQKLAPNDFALSTVNWVSCMITRTFGISLVASSIKYFSLLA